jgi:hypothetical protein
MQQFSTSQAQNVAETYILGHNTEEGTRARRGVCVGTLCCAFLHTAHTVRTCVPAACAILGEVSEQGNILDRVLPEEEPHRFAGLACRNATSAVQSTLPTCVCPEPVLADVRVLECKTAEKRPKKSVSAP